MKNVVLAIIACLLFYVWADPKGAAEHFSPFILAFQ